MTETTHDHHGHVAALYEDKVDGKWKASYQGAILASSKSRQYIIDTITKGMNKQANACGVKFVQQIPDGEAGEEMIAKAFEPIIKPKFTISERFQFLENLSQMTIEGTANAALVTGEGGLGKTHTVMSMVKAAGLTMTSDFNPPPPKDKKKKDKEDGEAGEESEEDEEEDEEEEVWVNPGQCHIVKGFSSAKGLYRTLYEMNGKVIIFDDCDSIQKNTDAVNILKGALDSGDERWISWNAEEGRGNNRLPRQFQFTGRVIFISNWNQNRIDVALRTRCLRVDLSMTTAEKIERMAHIIEQDGFQNHVPMEVKRAALDFLNDHQDVASNLSLRSLLDTINIIRAGKPNWERQALYTLSA